jgi:amino acid permease
MFGKLQDFSIRTGAMGLISAILGTGVLALPNGIAHYGWATSMVALLVSAVFQIICYYLFAHVQSLVRFNLENFEF